MVWGVRNSGGYKELTKPCPRNTPLLNCVDSMELLGGLLGQMGGERSRGESRVTQVSTLSAGQYGHPPIPESSNQKLFTTFYSAAKFVSDPVA